MAQKRYEFDFVMQAVLNGGFSATFTKAQQEFIRLGNEIKNLQAIQRDISSWQKQDAAVKNTDAKLDNLRRQYELVEQQIKETTGSTTALEREKLKLEQRIANTEGALEKQRQKLEETKDRLDAAGVSTDNLAGKDEALKKKIEELTEEQKKATEGAEGFGDKGAAAIEAVGGAIAAAGITDAMKGIADAYSECVEVAADFEQAMSAVEAIADSSASEMAALTAEAKELGATTIYTAQQSANAMEYMAMAGWDAQEMLNGMGGVINLAAAAGEDLAQVSDIVTDNLTAFGLQASDTAHFADVLAAAAANSNTNISIMGETFKSSSSVAGALGYSIEDVAVMVGLMANAAVKGSRAGTALRNIFDGLLGKMTLTADAFGEVDYSAVNTDGSMKGLMETVADLRGYFDLMTESEKVMNAKDIAGMRGYNGLLAILRATDEDFQSLYESINDCTGAAERMASVKLDNLNGDVTIMNSAMEALKSTIGEQFNPELRELARTGTEVLNWANGFIRENPALVKGIMAGGTAFGVLATAIVGVNAALGVFQALNLAALFTGPAGAILGVAAGIAGVTAAVVGYTEATRDGGPAVRELTVAAREMNDAIAEAGDTCEKTTASALAAAEVANTYIDKLEAMGDMANASDEEQKQYQNTLALLLRVMPELSDCISTTTDEYGRATYTLETTTEVLRTNTEEWKRNAKAQAYQEYLSSIMEKYNDVMLEAAGNAIKLTEANIKLEKAEDNKATAVARMNELASKSSQWTEEELIEYNLLQDAVFGYIGEIVELESEIGTLTEAQRRDNEALAEAEEEMSTVETAWRELMKALGLYAEEQENVMGEERAIQGALADTKNKLQELADEYEEAYEEAKKSVEGQFGLFDEAKASTDATIENAQKALDSQLKYWQDFSENMETLKGISADDLNTTQENLAALIDFLKDGGPEAAGLIASIAKDIKGGKLEVVGHMADTIGQITDIRDQDAQDMADWISGLTEQMDEFIRDMKEEIGELNLSKEAKEYGRVTIQSWLDGADGMLPQARAEIGRLVGELKTALTGSYVKADISIDDYWNRSGSERIRTAGFFASGTDNPPPGWAWVGEEGPELMRLHSGEQILPSHVSQEAARDYHAYSKYSGEYAAAMAVQGIQSRTPAPLEVVAGSQTSGGTTLEMHFHVEAGAPPETVDALREYAWSGEFEEAVMNAVEKADADKRRRTMS